MYKIVAPICVQQVKSVIIYYLYYDLIYYLLHVLQVPSVILLRRATWVPVLRSTCPVYRIGLKFC